jgi:hypothetical protein
MYGGTCVIEGGVDGGREENEGNFDGDKASALQVLPLLTQSAALLRISCCLHWARCRSGADNIWRHVVRGIKASPYQWEPRNRVHGRADYHPLS